MLSKNKHENCNLLPKEALPTSYGVKSVFYKFVQDMVRVYGSHDRDILIVWDTTLTHY